MKTFLSPILVIFTSLIITVASASSPISCPTLNQLHYNAQTQKWSTTANNWSVITHGSIASLPSNQMAFVKVYAQNSNPEADTYECFYYGPTRVNFVEAYTRTPTLSSQAIQSLPQTNPNFHIVQANLLAACTNGQNDDLHHVCNWSP